MKCRIDTDAWADNGAVYFVHSYLRRPNSTAVELTLEASDGTIETRVVAFHQIEWIEE